MKTIISIGAILLFALAGYGIWTVTADHSANAKDEQGQAAGAAGQFATPVQAVTVTKKSVQIWQEFSARLEPVAFADIKPQVTGRITDVKFQDGAIVEKDQVLFVIDERPYQAAVNQAKAELKAAQNDSALAWKELKRAKELIKTDAISKRIYDERSSRFLTAQSLIEGVKARLETAQINLDYANVKAPISGKTSRVEIKLGNVVQAGPNAPILTSIVSNEGIYADFEMDDQVYLNYMRSGSMAADKTIPVKLNVSGVEKPYEGILHSFDNKIDTQSGTIRARAFFENEDNALLPGMYGTIAISSADKVDNILIPATAIGTDQDRQFVYVINQEGMSEYRQINPGAIVGDQRIILDGLSEGDQVIATGINRIRPNMPVNPNAAQGGQGTGAQGQAAKARK